MNKFDEKYGSQSMRVNVRPEIIKDNNYVYYSIFQPNEQAPNFYRSLFRYIIKIFHPIRLKFIARNIKRPFYNRVEPLRHVLFFPVTNNNNRVLEPIWSNLQEGTCSILTFDNREDYIPSNLVSVYSILNIFALISLYIQSNPRERLIIRTYFDEFFSVAGYIKVYDKLLSHSDVRLIILANDHSVLTRALFHVAERKGIKTIYLQHCSVTEKFPKLRFDYCFLDGEESLLKYLQAGKPSGRVYLSGNPRFDAMVKCKVKQRSNQKNIGIALSDLDNEEDIRNFFIVMLKHGFQHLTVRPHPAAKFDSTWYEEHGIAYSNSKVENPFEFVSRMDIVIAGESGIHLDAAMMNVRSICYDISNTIPGDYYSYIKNGLVPYAASIEELFALIENEDADLYEGRQMKARWYNAAYGTQYEGHIGEMIADFIRHEQNNDIEGFDQKYKFENKNINGVNVRELK